MALFCRQICKLFFVVSLEILLVKYFAEKIVNCKKFKIGTKMSKTKIVHFFSSFYLDRYYMIFSVHMVYFIYRVCRWYSPCYFKLSQLWKIWKNWMPLGSSYLSYFDCIQIASNKKPKFIHLCCKLGILEIVLILYHIKSFTCNFSNCSEELDAAKQFASIGGSIIACIQRHKSSKTECIQSVSSS